MKTKKAATHDDNPRDEPRDLDDGPRRYTLHAASPEDRGHAAYGTRRTWGDWSSTGHRHLARRATDLKKSPAAVAGQGTAPAITRTLANHARPERHEPQYIPQAMRPENPFRQSHAAAARGRSSRHKVTLPTEFVEWAERQGFPPADAARFVLAWFTEREKVDKPVKVQYTCTNTAWPTNAPRTKKM